MKAFSCLMAAWRCFGRCSRRAKTQRNSGDRHERSLQVFPFNDLRTATRGFHGENKLGQGGFGVVYKGELVDGRVIAVKKLSVGSRQGAHEFVNEVRLLTTVQHRNLIKLFGCCVEGSERLLVYEYLSNGSLDRHLFDDKAGIGLDWRARRDILLGTAKGLKYLHEDSRVRMVHRDIKPSNILLDDRFVPKIADFGMAKFFSDDQTHVSTRMAGTLGYLAPEYALQGRLTEKADIFSFGVVALEVVSGRKNTKPGLPREKRRLLQWGWKLYEEQNVMELVDPRLMNMEVTKSGGSSLAEEATRVVHIALLCTQAEPSLRPTMSKVVLLLCGQSQIRQIPTRPAFVEILGESSGQNTESSAGPVTNFSQHHSLFDSFSVPTDSIVTNDDTQLDPR